MIQVRDLCIEIGGRTLVDHASFTAARGDKVGIVGRNGQGKTTLLRTLARDLPGGEGKVKCQGALGYLPQDSRTAAGNLTTRALDRVLSGRGLDGEPARIEQLRLRMAADHSNANVSAFAIAEEAFRLAGGYQAEAEAFRVAAGVGLSKLRLEQPLSQLSGGERRRIDLARVLFGHSDVLLLDEPTNHLDADAKRWLMEFLGSYRGTLLVVSHDLALLDKAITRVLHVHDGTLTQYRGTYSQCIAAQTREEKRLARQAAHQEEDIRRLSSLADAMRHQSASRARTAKSIDNRVERMKEIRVVAPRPERQSRFSFPEPPRAGRTVIDAQHLSKQFGKSPIFRDLSFSIERGERFLIVGLNGAGKTTLLKILTGQLPPSGGVFRLGLGVELGYYAQEHENLKPDATVLENLRTASTAPDTALRAVLGRFGLHGDVAHRHAGSLSGGEKTRLSLARLLAGQHNVLLLDEPTNNLDPAARAATAGALAQWPGTMLIVSHDVEFVDMLQPVRIMHMPRGVIDFWQKEMHGLVSVV